MALKPVSLDDKYDLSQTRVFVTGLQALVRLCLMQKERDRRAGRNTAGYVTGYRGSPLGGLDQQFMRAKGFIDQYDVVEYRDMVTIVRDRIQNAIKRGMTFDQVKAAGLTKDYDGRYGSTAGAWTTDMFIEAAYRSLTAR